MAEPSGRIFAIVVVLLMSCCSPSRDDPSSLTAFSVGDMQDHAFAHSKQVDWLLAVIYAVIDPFDRERIVQRFGALLGLLQNCHTATIALLRINRCNRRRLDP